MSDDNKRVIGLVTKTATASVPIRKTYLQLIEDHISRLTDEQKNSTVETLIICGEHDDGVYYVVLAGESVSAAVGLLEINKMSIMESYS